MKRLFLFLLKRYSQTEEERLEIYDMLYKQTCETYNEQTPFGNVFNANIEFVMGNNFVQKLVKENNEKALELIISNINGGANAGILFLQNPETNDH
jgi:hypothetical protein